MRNTSAVVYSQGGQPYDELILEYLVDKPLKGYIGIWTKADSVTYFEGLTIERDLKIKTFEF